MRSLGASGGYLVACGTDYILANRLTLTGSIGVIIGALNYAELFGKIGLRADIYKSGAMKDILNGSRQPTEAEKAYVQGLVDETFREFARLVAEGRDRYETADEVLRSPVGDGRILTGRQALDFGLVDGLGYFEDAVAKAKELAEVEDARVIRYRRLSRWAEMLFAMQGGRGTGLDALVPREVGMLRPGRLYYLMPTAVP
jgi:protease-4